jgi:acyl carrier protein
MTASSSSIILSWPKDPFTPRVIETIERVIGPLPRGRGARAPSPTSNLCADLRFDSLDFVSLAVELEEAFLIEIPDDETASWRTVADVVGTVRAANSRRFSQETADAQC